MSAEVKFERDRYISRSRSRSPFRKNFNERLYNDDDYKRRREYSPDMRRSAGNAAKNRVFVNNIPFECRWMEIKDIFREKVGDVAFVELFEDDNGKFKGCGIVEFKDNETAQKAVELMHKHEVRGRQLNVKIDSGEMMDRRRTASRPSDREFMRSNDGFGNEFRSEPSFNTYGLNPEFLKSLGIVGPLNNKVFISNLDYKVTEKKLEEIFKIAGKVSKVELNVDNEGKSKGHGTAEYEHPLEAVQAISMFNGQRLYARIINVRMDKFADDDTMPAKLPSGLHGIGKGLGMNGQPMQFNKTASGVAPNGSFGFGMGLGSGMSGGGIGVGSSNMGMLSSSSMNLSGSLGMSSERMTMAAERMMNASALGMGMTGGSSMSLPSPVGMGMGGSSSMMSSGSVMGRSAMDSISRDGAYPLGSGVSRSFRDEFDRHSDSFSRTDTVLLGNLPSSFSWQGLKDRFRDIGDVRFAELKGQGNALIRFGSVQDAQRAVDLMNGFRIDGRAIQVRFY